LLKFKNKHFWGIVKIRLFNWVPFKAASAEDQRLSKIQSKGTTSLYFGY